MKNENDMQKPSGSKLEEKLFDLSKNDFNLALLPYLADILTDNVLSDKVRSLRLEAWYGLKMGLTKLLNDGISMLHLSSIAKKKGALIMKMTSHPELEKLLNSPPPHFDGNRFVAEEYLTPEEEIILWGKYSLVKVPTYAMGKRAMELFKTLYPEKFKEVFPEK